MAFFVQLLANYAGLIYIGCAIGVIFYIREIVAARNDLTNSLYSLEREAASGRIARGMFMIVVFVAIAFATNVLSTVVAPQLAADALAGTPTPAFIPLTDTPAPTIQPSPTPTITPQPTPSLPGNTVLAATGPAPDTPTPAAAASALPAASCPDPNVQLIAPTAGQIFSGDIQLRGTADAPNFAFYKFTLKGPATNDTEQTVGDVVRAPRRNDVLGSIDSAALLAQPGVYIVSLVVVDNTGNEYPHCMVPIIVQPSPP